MSTNTYYALTTGPILETIFRAKSTRAIWTASYSFSYLIKQIMIKYSDGRGFERFIMPYAAVKGIMFNHDNHTGLFPDRIIWYANETEQFSEFQAISETVIKEFALSVWNDIQQYQIANHEILTSATKFSDSGLEEFLLNYIKCYALKIDLQESDNPILKISTYLDSLELSPQSIGEQGHSLFFNWLELRFKGQYRNFLVKDAYADKLAQGIDTVRFDSVIEIATAELGDQLFSQSKSNYWSTYGGDESDIYNRLFDSSGKEIKRYHKYAAVLQADGDNMSKILGALFQNNIALPTAEKLNAFSSFLFEYSIAVVKLIESYGGVAVYIGGDDILAILPVVYNDDSVFKLIQSIDAAFYKILYSNEQLVTALQNIKEKPSMTYGIAIGYYKHPLAELIKESHHQMSVLGKSRKNAIAYKLTKHSGTIITDCFQQHGYNGKNNEQNGLLPLYIELRKALLAPSANDTDGLKFISSIQFKLSLNKPIIINIIDDDVNFNSFFDNNFNEKVHQGSKFIELIKKVLSDTFKHNLTTAMPKKEAAESAINSIFAMLRFTQFSLQKAENE